MKFYVYNDLYFNLPNFGNFDGYIRFFSSLQSNGDYVFYKTLPNNIIDVINSLTSQNTEFGLYLDSSTRSFLNSFLEEIVQQNIQVSSPSGPVDVKDIFFTFNIFPGNYIYFAYVPSQSRYKASVLCIEELNDIFDDKGLYPELLNNEETVSNLNTYINGGDVSMITDKDLAFQKNIELYNANVLLLRSTCKVDASVSGSISQSGQSQSVDLTPVVQQLSNINNKLQTTEQIDYSQKSITDVLNQQANTIQVDDIGLLRSKKGYY